MPHHRSVVLHRFRPVSGGYFTLFPPMSAQASVIMSRTIWSAGRSNGQLQRWHLLRGTSPRGYLAFAWSATLRCWPVFVRSPEHDGLADQLLRGMFPCLERATALFFRT